MLKDERTSLFILHTSTFPQDSRPMKKKAPGMAVKARKKSRDSSELTGDFDSLVASIVQIHHQTQDFAARSPASTTSAVDFQKTRPNSPPKRTPGPRPFSPPRSSAIPMS